MILVIMPEALKYKPYHSRLYFILFFFLLDSVISKIDEMKFFFDQCSDSIPHHALILWAPKIISMFVKYKTKEDEVKASIMEKRIEQLKRYEQYLYLIIKPFTQVNLQKD